MCKDLVSQEQGLLGHGDHGALWGVGVLLMASLSIREQGCLWGVHPTVCQKLLFIVPQRHSPPTAHQSLAVPHLPPRHLSAPPPLSPTAAPGWGVSVGCAAASKRVILWAACPSPLSQQVWQQGNRAP